LNDSSQENKKNHSGLTPFFAGSASPLFDLDSVKSSEGEVTNIYGQSIIFGGMNADDDSTETYIVFLKRNSLN